MRAAESDGIGSTALPEFKLETYLGRWEFTARHHMTASDAETLTVRELLALGGDAALDVLLDTRLSYTEPYGAPDLRAAIAETYDSCAAEDVLCFAGAEEGVYCLYRTLLGPDDHAIVVTPNYQSAETVPLSLCATTGVALDEREAWTLHVHQVAAAIRPNTRVVYINFPHNPTGKILERDRFDDLVALCRLHGIWLFSDEVYRLIERDPARRLPQAVDAYERGVSLNVMSKAYGLPALRVGWIACRDRDLLERMVRLKHYLSICNSAPSERLSLVALRHRKTVLERTRAVARAGYTQVAAFLAEFPELFETYEPDGGVVMFPRYKGANGVERFCRRLVEEAGAVLLPASIYASALTPTPTDRFRIGYGRSNLDDGLAAMRAFIRSNRP
ncbi:aminotransferase [Sandarakinorhabdus cyanobacteriorum]|uniref:Aminotransferase n=2 Tax=Sandarakinorhabdus cyanobacteriorum TaxID=1981098 RepID=A0A255Z2N2_9SPHN|nr:aminotransferase [Sandarakinorhabdus cyanobacteriorum]